jgi:C4-dicarboxylate-specific signal transduction histidine kinase
VIGGFRGTLESCHLETGDAAMFELLIWKLQATSPADSYAALLQPVTDRVRQERNRGDWQARFERAVRISGDGILDWDLERKRTFFSSRFRSILSDSSPPAPLTLAIWKQRIVREDRRRVDQAINQHLLHPHEPFEIEHRLRTNAGSTRHVILRGQAIADAAGRPYRLICSLRDTTEQREAEARTRQLLGDLAHVQRQSTAGELAASIAHELNQPLAAIVSFASGVLRKSSSMTHPDELDDILQKIRKQALRGGEIIRRLRQFVRRDPILHSPVDLNRLATEVIELLTPESQERKVSLAAELAVEPLIIQADSIQIQQVLVNLLRNSIDAVQPLTAKRRLITVRSQETPEGIELIVEDLGPGIDPGIFTQLGTSMLSTKKDGLGMGLSLSRSIMQAHGGTLFLVASRVGTKIGLRLPKLTH